VPLVLLLLTAFVIFAIAAVTVGRVAFVGARTARQSVFDLDEAVDYVADRLPPDLQARLTHQDVHTILGWYLDELESKKVAYERDELRLPEPIDEEVDPDEPADDDGDEPVLDEIVVDEDRIAARIISRTEKAGLEMNDVDVMLVLGECEDYLRAIGAIGGRAD
jgi:hypothetical protein